MPFAMVNPSLAEMGSPTNDNPVNRSAHSRKVDDQSVVFLANSGGNFVGNVLICLTTLDACVDSAVLTFQQTPENRHMDNFGHFLCLILRDDSIQFRNCLIDN